MRIDIIKSTTKCYSFEAYITQQLQKSLKRLNIDFQEVDFSEISPPDYLERIENTPPHWTLSFSNILFQLKPWSEITGLPHFFWPSTPLEALRLLENGKGVVGLSDRVHYNRLKRSFPLTFLPPAVDPELTYDEEEQRPFEVVLFHPFDEQDEKLKMTLETLKGCRIDLFGDHRGNNLLKRVKNGSHLFLHPPLVFSQHFEILKKAQVLLCLDPREEWILPALYLGCYVVTRGSRYLKENFPSLSYFRDLVEVRELVFTHLKNRNPLFFHGMEKEILNHHTYAHRISKLLSSMEHHANRSSSRR